MAKRIGFTLPVWNEENMLPLWMERVLELKPDMIFIYDDGSTDGTWKLLEKYKEELGDLLYIEKQSEPHTEYFVRNSSEGVRLNKHLSVAYKYNIDWLVVMGCDELLSLGAEKLLGYIRDGKREWVQSISIPTYNLYNNLDTYITKNLKDGAVFFPDFHSKILNLNATNWYYLEVKKLDLTDPLHRGGDRKHIFEDGVGTIHLHYLFNECRVRHSDKMIVLRGDDLWITKKLNMKKIIPECLIKWFNNEGSVVR